MDNTKFAHRISTKLIKVQNILKNEKIEEDIQKYVLNETTPKYSDIILSVDYCIENKDSIVLLDSSYLENFDKALDDFINNTEDEYNIHNYHFKILTSIHIILTCKDELFEAKNNKNQIKKDKDNLTKSHIQKETAFTQSDNSVLKSQIEELEKKNFEIVGQFSELKNLFEKRETEFFQITEILEKSKTLENDFNNAKNAILKNVELKQATTYWEEQAKEYNKQYRYYFFINIVIAIMLIISSFSIINMYDFFVPSITASNNNFETFKDLLQNVPFFKYIIFVLYTSIVIWIMKILVKIMLSNYHLKVDANERVIMINTYLVLLEDGKGFNTNDRKVILDNIFRQTNHGIIKDETGVTVVDIINSLKK